MGRTISKRMEGNKDRLRPMLVSVYWCILLLFVSSCDHGAVVDEFQPIPERAWAYSFRPSFELPVADHTKPYDLKLNLRVTSEYKYANIYVLVRQKNPDGTTQTDRVQLRLAANDGRWLGQGGGGLYTYQSTFKKNYHFPDTGKYIIEIEQNMRDNPLQQVSDVGICLTNAK